MNRLVLGLLTALTLVTSAHAGWVITMPDGSDSIGIPIATPYRGTCFGRCERVRGFQVTCDAWQRPSSTPSWGSVDCATHCRYDAAELPLVLSNSEHPDSGWPGWRHATAARCLLVKRTDTGELLYPASHCENYQLMSLKSFGPADSECYPPDLPPGVPFVYIDPTKPATQSFAGRLLRTLTFRKQPMGQVVERPGPPGKLPGSYQIKQENREKE